MWLGLESGCGMGILPNAIAEFLKEHLIPRVKCKTRTRLDEYSVLEFATTEYDAILNAWVLFNDALLHSYMLEDGKCLGEQHAPIGSGFVCPFGISIS